MLKTSLATIALSAVIILWPCNAAAAPDLTVTIGQHSITASGLVPGGSAVFFGIAQVPIPHAYMSRIQRWAVIVDIAGHDGTATFDLHENVPRTSVWAVVDLRNAHYGTVSGPGVRLREIALDNPLRKGQALAVNTFSFDHSYLDLLYVHPGLGAWTWSALAGVNSDRDDKYGSTVVTLPEAHPLGSFGLQPSSFVPGGIFVAVDATRMEIAVVRLDEAMIGGAR